MEQAAADESRRPDRARRNRQLPGFPGRQANPNTLRAYTSVLDRVGEEIDTRRRLAEVLDDEIAGALIGLWGDAKPATWNRNRAAVGSWLAWCAARQHWTTPALPAAAQRRRENNDSTKAKRLDEHLGRLERWLVRGTRATASPGPSRRPLRRSAPTWPTSGDLAGLLPPDEYAVRLAGGHQHPDRHP